MSIVSRRINKVSTAFVSKAPRFRKTRSNMFIPTMKTAPQDVTSQAHALLLRAGLIRQLSAGCYTYLPVGLRALRRIEAAIDTELQDIGGQKVDFPSLMTEKLWRSSGRWQTQTAEMFTLQDRKKKGMLLGPTHEEAVTSLVSDEVHSYKQLPLMLYQTGKKFRDEMRPRGGLLRAKEFYMNDMYSFDETREDAETTYAAVSDAYFRIMQRLGLEHTAIRVAADSGSIGGNLSHEYHVRSETSGEDTLVNCKTCGRTANKEKAEGAVSTSTTTSSSSGKAEEEEEKFTGTDLSSVMSFLGEQSDCVYEVVVPTHQAKGVTPVGVWLAAGQTANPYALKPLLTGETEYRRASAAEVATLTAEGMLQMQVLDVSVTTVLSTETYTALTAVPGVLTANVREVVEGDTCVASTNTEQICGGDLEFTHGIEVGHVFYLGTKYSGKMKATFKPKQGKNKPFEMGCFGLGVSRLLSAIVDVHGCEKGVRWPLEVAPYYVNIITGNKQMKLSDTELLAIEEEGVECYDALSRVDGMKDMLVLDDRTDVSMGYKLKDAELLGFPITIVLGNTVKDGNAEVQMRLLDVGGIVTERTETVQLADLAEFVHAELALRAD